MLPGIPREPLNKSALSITFCFGSHVQRREDNANHPLNFFLICFSLFNSMFLMCVAIPCTHVTITPHEQ